MPHVPTRGLFETHLTVADLDGDGSLDLAGYRNLGRTIAVLKGSSSGTFSLFFDGSAAGVPKSSVS